MATLQKVLHDLKFFIFHKLSVPNKKTNITIFRFCFNNKFDWTCFKSVVLIALQSTFAFVLSLLKKFDLVFHEKSSFTNSGKHLYGCDCQFFSFNVYNVFILSELFVRSYWCACSDDASSSLNFKCIPPVSLSLIW